MALLLRLNKAAPLTNAELDNNLIFLDDRCTTLESTKLSSVDLLAHIKFVGGLGSGIDADKLDGMTPTDQNLFSSVVARDSFGNFSAGIITATLAGHANSATTANTLNGIVAIANGGTGATTLQPGYVLSNGTILHTQLTINGSDVLGSIQGLSAGVTSVIPLDLGGTGATTANEARNALGLILGQTVQPYSSRLQMLSSIADIGLLTYVGNVIVSRKLAVGNCLYVANADGVLGDPTLSITVLTVAQGGTGSTDAASARFALGVVADIDGILMGIPKTATAAVGTSTTQLATTEFVINNSVPTGTILTLASIIVPEGFILANGAQMLRSSYPKLYKEVGIGFGASDGSTTFTVPNFATPTGFISVIKI